METWEVCLGNEYSLVETWAEVKGAISFSLVAKDFESLIFEVVTDFNSLDFIFFALLSAKLTRAAILSQTLFVELHLSIVIFRRFPLDFMCTRDFSSLGFICLRQENLIVLTFIFVASKESNRLDFVFAIDFNLFDLIPPSSEAIVATSESVQSVQWQLCGAPNHIYSLD